MARFKAIIPQKLGLLDPRVAERAILEAGDEAAEVMVHRFQAILRKWKHKPKWTIKRKGFTWSVTTDDEVFHYQDEGTDGPYTIRPKRKRALSWKGARHPVRRVRHPGLKAQDFTGTVQEQARNDFKELLEEEFRAEQRRAE